MAVVTALALGGCGGGGGQPEPAPTDAPGTVPPARFATVVSAPGTFTLNVHVPDEGSIAGTDASIPYDDVSARRDELPDRGTTIAIYCKTGRMSAIARRTLTRSGYRRIVELGGGMDAWVADGRRLLPAATR